VYTRPVISFDNNPFSYKTDKDRTKNTEKVLSERAVKRNISERLKHLSL